MKVQITKPNLSVYIKLDAEDPEEEQLLQDLLAGKSGICIEQEPEMAPKLSVLIKSIDVRPYEQLVKSYPNLTYEEWLKAKDYCDKRNKIDFKPVAPESFDGEKATNLRMDEPGQWAQPKLVFTRPALLEDAVLTAIKKLLNQLYNMLPAGDVTAWQLIQILTDHITSLDDLIFNIEAGMKHQEWQQIVKDYGQATTEEWDKARREDDPERDTL